MLLSRCRQRFIFYLATSLPVCLAQEPIENFGDIPPNLLALIPTYQISNCTQDQTAQLHFATRNLWADFVRARLDLDSSIPSPPFTTFFKAPSSISNVSGVYDNIVYNRPAPGQLAFHCVTQDYEKYSGEYQACLKLDAKVGLIVGTGDIAICPLFFRFPPGPAVGPYYPGECPRVENNIFVGENFRFTWARILGGIVALMFVVDANKSLFVGEKLNSDGNGPFRALEAVPGETTGLNDAVGRGIQESVTESLNYLWHMLGESRARATALKGNFDPKSNLTTADVKMAAVRDHCKDYPDIRLPPWNFSLQDNTAIASQIEPGNVQPIGTS